MIVMIRAHDWNALNRAQKTKSSELEVQGRLTTQPQAHVIDGEIVN